MKLLFRCVRVAVTAILAATLTPCNSTAVGQGAAKQASADSDSSLRAKPGYVRGTATDLRGTPLSQVEVRIYGTTLAGEKTSFTTRTKNGKFEMRVPDGIYGVSADATISYHGESHELALYSAKAGQDQESAGGIVANFLLKIRGSKPDPTPSEDYPGNFFGGYVNLEDEARQLNWNEKVFSSDQPLPEDEHVEVTLTPDGPLIDGTQGKTLTFRHTPQDDLISKGLLDVPVGRYTITARIVSEGGKTRPLNVARSYGASASDKVTATVLPYGVASDLSKELRVFLKRSFGAASPTSELTGIALPEGAARSTDDALLKPMTETLQVLAKQRGKRAADPEILLWISSSYKRSRADRMIAEVARALQAVGYTYQESQRQPAETQLNNGLIDKGEYLPFLAGNERQQILGLWIIQDVGLMLVWCRLE